jgi:hypothetical protein
MRPRLDGTAPSALRHDNKGVGGTGHEEATGEATVEVWMLRDGGDGVRVWMERKGKVFQTCGSAIFSQNHSTVREESADDPRAPLSLWPRDRYRQAWHHA